MQPAEVCALRFICFFPPLHYCYSLALEKLQLHIFHMRRHRFAALFLIQLYFRTKFCPSEFLLGPLETLLRSMSGSQVKIFPRLDGLQLLILFTGTLTYLKPKLFFLIVFHNGRYIILKYYFAHNA
jgi:hypothetical protein